MTIENRKENIKELTNAELEERLKQVENLDEVFTTLHEYHATFGIRQQIDEAYTFHKFVDEGIIFKHIKNPRYAIVRYNTAMVFMADMKHKEYMGI